MNRKHKRGYPEVLAVQYRTLLLSDHRELLVKFAPVTSRQYAKAWANTTQYVRMMDIETALIAEVSRET